MKVGGLKRVHELRNEVFKYLPITIRDSGGGELRVFGSEEEAKAGKKAVSEEFE